MDRRSFDRVLSNLFSNAIDAAKSSIGVFSQVSDTSLIIRIVDDGPGVPEEFIPKLFERGSTTKHSTGTGLGLSYAQSVMRAHGGDVSYSREGGRTVFECSFPNSLSIEFGETDSNTQSVENFESESNVRTVSICLSSDPMSRQLLDLLTANEREIVFLIGYHTQASVVVSNQETLSGLAIEEGKAVIELSSHLTVEEMHRKITRRMGLGK